MSAMYLDCFVVFCYLLRTDLDGVGGREHWDEVRGWSSSGGRDDPLLFRLFSMSAIVCGDD